MDTESREFLYAMIACLAGIIGAVTLFFWWYG
jgi:hypothetical protein